MSPRKKATNPIAQSENETISSNINPLVFISHDTRDAELAEEFSNLLKSASAGALKSFRSSDKKGTQGIEYGSSMENRKITISFSRKQGICSIVIWNAFIQTIDQRNKNS